MTYRDKLGWPVVGIKNRPIVSFFRRIIHTNIRKTWAMRNEGWPKQQEPDPNVTSFPNVSERNNYLNKTALKMNQEAAKNLKKSEMPDQP